MEGKDYFSSSMVGGGSSTLLLRRRGRKFAYYSPSHPRFDDQMAALAASAMEFRDRGNAAIPCEEELDVLHVRKREVKPLDMKREISVEKRLVQNEQYKTEVQTKLRLQTRKQELDRQKKFRSNYTSYSTSFARSSNTSSMSYNRNKPRNTVRVIRQLRERHRVENKSLAQSMRKESNARLSSAKSRLTESKLRAAEVQRKEGIENEHLVLETRVKDQEEITSTVQGQKMVHDVLSSLVRSDMMFAKRFQNLNNSLYEQVRKQRQKMQKKNSVTSNKAKVEIQNKNTKRGHEKAKSVMTSRMAKIKKDTAREQEVINTHLTAMKEINGRADLAVKARMKHDFDLHQSLNPEAFVTRTEKAKEKTIPWAGATSRRLDIFIDQTNKKLLPLTQVVSASEALEDEDMFDDDDEED